MASLWGLKRTSTCHDCWLLPWLVIWPTGISPTKQWELGRAGETDLTRGSSCQKSAQIRPLSDHGSPLHHSYYVFNIIWLSYNKASNLQTWCVGTSTKSVSHHIFASFLKPGTVPPSHLCIVVCMIGPQGVPATRQAFRYGSEKLENQTIWVKKHVQIVMRILSYQQWLYVRAINGRKYDVSHQFPSAGMIRYDQVQFYLRPQGARETY